MRIGLFGGTFNPVHLGHLRAALEVREGFCLDEIVMIPAALPPHKMPGVVADASDRLAMLNLAIEDTTGLNTSDVELKRKGPSYTIDTVYHFKRTLPDKSMIYLIMGLDAFLEIDTWKSYEELLAQLPLIVINRPSSNCQASDDAWITMKDFLISKISADYAFSTSQSCYLAENKQAIYVFEVTALDISSTIIRKRIKEGRSIEFLVPPKIAEFVNNKGLYL
jgi:nicotinate-nucleotide adenylyltransferase